MRTKVEMVGIAIIVGLGGWLILEPLLLPAEIVANRPWYLGTGVALLLVALLNLARRAAGRSPAVSRICLAGNLLALTAAVTVVVATGLPEAWVGLAAILLTTLVSMPTPEALLDRVQE